MQASVGMEAKANEDTAAVQNCSRQLSISRIYILAMYRTPAPSPCDARDSAQTPNVNGVTSSSQPHKRPCSGPWGARGQACEVDHCRNKLPAGIQLHFYIYSLRNIHRGVMNNAITEVEAGVFLHSWGRKPAQKSCLIQSSQRERRCR